MRIISGPTSLRFVWQLLILGDSTDDFNTEMAFHGHSPGNSGGVVTSTFARHLFPRTPIWVAFSRLLRDQLVERYAMHALPEIPNVDAFVYSV